MEHKDTKETVAENLVEKEDAGNADVISNPGQLSERSKKLRTLLIYITYLFHGMQNNLLGPSLLDLEYLTGSSTTAISTLFTWKNGGYLLGALMAGSIVDRVNENLVMSGALFLMCVSVAIAPFCRSLVGLSVTYGVMGYSASVNTIGAATTVIAIWSSRSDPYQMALHFVVNAGAAISPQIFKPFLRKSPSSNNTNLTMVQEYYNNDTTSYSNQNIAYQHTPRDSTIHVAYLIIASGILLLALSHFFVFIHDGRQIRRSLKKSNKSHASGAGIRGMSKIIALSMFVMLSFMQGGIEELFGGFLMAFVVKHMKWTKEIGTDLITLFWASTSCSRGLGIIGSKFLPASTILAMDVGLLAVSGIIFAFGLSLHWIIPWICTVLTGVGVGTTLGSLINWGNYCLTFRGKETSVIFAAGSLSKMTTLALVGHLFEAVSPMWFTYVNVLLSLTFLAIFFLSFIVIRYVTLKQESRKATETSVSVELKSYSD